MGFDLAETLALLERAPAVLDALLRASAALFSRVRCLTRP
jgi:hypothetical protein